jgi:hypothetical protein
MQTAVLALISSIASLGIMRDSKFDEMLQTQIVWLFVLAIPVACVAWTVTHEELFREPREWCSRQSRICGTLAQRKFFYVFTCEYCFSHYIAALTLLITRYKLLFDDWRGYLVAGFALVWIANLYMSLFGRLRIDIRHERAETAVAEKEAEAVTDRSRLKRVSSAP